MSSILLATAVLVAVVWLAAPQLVTATAGRWVMLGALAILPLSAIGTGVAVGVERSTDTAFCLSCHEMEPYGKSLFVDGGGSLAASHYQQRLIARDSTCYSCHTDYAMFGDLKAKLNGLRHVWVHYAGEAPERLELYQPYPNYNCLHCHDDARPFVEHPVHRPQLAELRSGARSCLTCHRTAHDHAGVAERRFWISE